MLENNEEKNLDFVKEGFFNKIKNWFKNIFSKKDVNLGKEEIEILNSSENKEKFTNSIKIDSEETRRRNKTGRRV
jgi:deoxyadenosine/deoxycytidine kinase